MEMLKLAKFLTLIVFVFAGFLSPAQKPSSVGSRSVSIIIPPSSHSRIQFAATRLSDALQKFGYSVKIVDGKSTREDGKKIYLGVFSDEIIQNTFKTLHLVVT